MQSRIVFALVLAALVGVAISAPNMIPRVTMVRPTTLTHGWLEQGRSDPDARTQLVFAVKNDVEGVSILERYVKDISHPKSPRYGQWMSLEAVQRLTANPAGEQQIVQWLLSHRGVDESMLSVYENAGFIKVQNLPISVAEVLLESRFYEYRRTHHQTGKVEVAHRARSISIPAALAPHVAFVAYSHVLPRQTGAHRFRSLTLAPQGKVGAASGSVTPQLLFQTYNIDNPVVDNIAASNSLFESLGQDFSPDDLTTYCQQNNIPNQQISQVVGPNTPSACGTNPDSCGEANLDVQVISAVAQNANTTYWSIPGDQEPFLPWLIAVSSSSNPPLVHSVSYGDVESTTGTDVLGHFNTELLKLAARGVTVVVSSGDDGVANFIARSDPTQCGFNPAFPASSPYVVSVGATQGPEFGTPEIACASNTNGLITTGGGFSNYFGIPSYQANEISAFLNQPTLPPTNQFNTTGRGYPDVSLLGHNYNVVLGGQTYQESGTSASAPAFAALLTLINAARLDAGKSAVGFVNPAIYHIYETDPQVFNDITSGENNCCAGQPGQQTCCQYGFNAVSGWDGATGLGSVNFVGLKKAFLNL